LLDRIRMATTREESGSQATANVAYVSDNSRAGVACRETSE